MITSKATACFTAGWHTTIGKTTESMVISVKMARAVPAG